MSNSNSINLKRKTIPEEELINRNSNNNDSNIDINDNNYTPMSTADLDPDISMNEKKTSRKKAAANKPSNNNSSKSKMSKNFNSVNNSTINNNFNNNGFSNDLLPSESDHSRNENIKGTNLNVQKRSKSGREIKAPTVLDLGIKNTGPSYTCNNNNSNTNKLTPEPPEKSLTITEISSSSSSESDSLDIADPFDDYRMDADFSTEEYNKMLREGEYRGSVSHKALKLLNSEVLTKSSVSLRENVYTKFKMISGEIDDECIRRLFKIRHTCYPDLADFLKYWGSEIDAENVLKGYIKDIRYDIQSAFVDQNMVLMYDLDQQEKNFKNSVDNVKQIQKTVLNSQTDALRQTVLQSNKHDLFDNTTLLNTLNEVVAGLREMKQDKEDRLKAENTIKSILEKSNKGITVNFGTFGYNPLAGTNFNVNNNNNNTSFGYSGFSHFSTTDPITYTPSIKPQAAVAALTANYNNAPLQTIRPPSTTGTLHSVSDIEISDIEPAGSQAGPASLSTENKSEILQLQPTSPPSVHSSMPSLSPPSIPFQPISTNKMRLEQRASTKVIRKNNKSGSGYLKLKNSWLHRGGKVVLLPDSFIPNQSPVPDDVQLTTAKRIIILQEADKTFQKNWTTAEVVTFFTSLYPESFNENDSIRFLSREANKNTAVEAKWCDEKLNTVNIPDGRGLFDKYKQLTYIFIMRVVVASSTQITIPSMP
jgi:hypothetical protein